MLPDFQGLGIGHAFCSAICQMYLDTGHRFILVSSVKSLFKQFNRDPRWVVYDKSRKKTGSTTAKVHGRSNSTVSTDRYTYSYEYIGAKHDVKSDVKQIPENVVFSADDGTQTARAPKMK